VADSLTFPPFHRRAPWWGRDLQTLRNSIIAGQGRRLAEFPGERLEFPLSDGSGDVLLGTLHIQKAGADRPLVVLIHGLTGSEDSVYVRVSAQALLTLGYPVLRLNLRGAGPSQGHCQHRYHAGRSEDLRQVLGLMDGRLAVRGLLLVGYSLGGNLMLKFLGEAGGRAMVLGAVSISAPIDLDRARRAIMRPRNVFYQRYLLTRLKEETRSLPLTVAEESELARVKTLYEFDDRILAPRVGFAGAEDYYRRSMALPFLGDIAVPTLIVQAEDDPWIPFATYRDYAWSANPRLLPLFAHGGGHVGFHGRGSNIPWQDRCMAEFFDRCRA
jgi:predicted alpha/beta-fold hydrolase